MRVSFDTTRHLLVAAGLLFALAAGSSCTKAPANEEERAALLYEQCAACHGPDGAGDARYLAPAIAGLDQAYLVQQLSNFKSGLRGAHQDDLAGLRMRPMARTLKTDADIQAVAALVSQMQPTQPAPTLAGGDATRGQSLYATCAACHGVDGKGNPALKAPVLTQANDWYLHKQIQNFRSGVRGANPEDLTGAQMRPMAMTLPDEQAILDVVAYIQTLRK